MCIFWEEIMGNRKGHKHITGVPEPKQPVSTSLPTEYRAAAAEHGFRVIEVHRMKKGTQFAIGTMNGERHNVSLNGKRNFDRRLRELRGLEGPNG